MDLYKNYKNLSIAVLGDYYLDEYFRIDAALNEPSLETGLVAYQCVKCESFPGASGTVAKNLANLGIGTVYAVGYTGDDGRGMEMRRGLAALGINSDNLITFPGRCTPTHTKPWITENGHTRELNRIDIKNWTTTPPELEKAVFEKVKALVKNIDALIILDHTAEDNFGIITGTMRNALAKLAKENPNVIFFADSRGRIGKFENMIIKGNQFELCHAVYGQAKDGGITLAADPTITRTQEEIANACKTLYKKTGCPVVCTLGENGSMIYADTITSIPTIPVTGELDVCGAGDMFSSAFVSALCAGADMHTAGKQGNVAAAICVQQLGTTGNVTQADIMEAINDMWDIEVVNPPKGKGFKYALFDFDGTVSLIREGWREIMIPYFVEVVTKADPASNPDEIEEIVADFVDMLTGKQTIFQCMRLDEEVQKRGGPAVEPNEYKKEYLRRLMERIKGRHASLKDGTAKPVDHLVPGVEEFLQLLKDSGVKVYLASGTDEDDVVAEAELLGVKEYFSGGIYGAKDDITDCSKELVIRQIIEENNIKGEDIISFGDGYIEVQLVHDIGGYTVAVATDEATRKGVNQWKRERLLQANADAVIPDFAEYNRLYGFVMSK